MKRIKVAIIIIVPLIIIIVLLSLTKYFRAVIPSSSMSPTIEVGDQLLVEKIEYTDINRGDLIVFEKDGELLIKRLIGLPGDTVLLQDGKVYVNGCLLNEEYVVNNDCDYSGQYFVSDNSYFLLGDNRADSKDSRYWDYPFINNKAIVGKAVMRIYPEIDILKRWLYEIY
jgi:signal peptidase I